MAPGARICPHCGALNSSDATTCVRCQKRLPGPVASTASETVFGVLGRDFPMTQVLAAMCVVVFAFMVLGKPGFPLFGGMAMSQILKWGGLVYGGGQSLGHLEPWRYAAAVFVHFGAIHLGFNMLALLDLGRSLEAEVGSARFVILFVLTGVAGFVVSDFWYVFWGSPAITAGASGSVFGLLGAMVGYTYARGDRDWKQRLARVVGYAIAAALLFSANNAAHVGGLIAGFPIGFIYYRDRRPWQLNPVAKWVAGALMLACVASLLLSNRSPIWQERLAIEQGQER